MRVVDDDAMAVCFTGERNACGVHVGDFVK